MKASERSVRFYDEKKLVEIVEWFKDNWKNQHGAVSRSQYGAAELVTPLNKDGTLPTLNFRGGSFNDAVKVRGEVLNKTILVSKSGCFACPVRCKPDVKGEKPYETDPSYGGPSMKP
ncbi:MAG: aldehyde ferredoxin oxidoreductase C-terminal domain-containing protein [Thermosphaera aggregans]|uniref:aldehyde ferredoxin oxidoreductase C-terminal domain-containing protein n=1 Tax=Thermosphaera aggregans TaxID=54254 RepID=UPI003C100F4D